MDARVSKLTAEGQAFVQAQLAAVEQFVTDYGSPHGGAGLAGLDHAWASWMDRQSVDPQDPDAIINAVGVALGQALIEALAGFTWVTVVQGADTDMAVGGRSGDEDVLIYPADVVAEEYEARAQTFLQQTRDSLVAEISQLHG